MSVAVQFESPTTLFVGGSTQCGKSQFIRKIIINKDVLFKNPPQKVYYCYGAWQELYDQLQKEESEIYFHEGLPSVELLNEWTLSKNPTLLILDDLINEVAASKEMLHLFTVLSHHSNCTCVVTAQSLFPPGRYARGISLNCHYLVVFSCKRNAAQAEILGRQIFPRQNKYFQAALEDATRHQYGYILIDVHPGSSSDFQLRTNIFPGEQMFVYQPL